MSEEFKRCLGCRLSLPIDYSKDLCPRCEIEAVERRAKPEDVWEELGTIGRIQNRFMRSGNSFMAWRIW